MNRFAGFFRNITWVGFLAALIFSYSYITSSVAYRIDIQGNELGIADKDTFFFGSIAIFIVVNAICMGFVAVLKKIKTTEDGNGIRNRSLKLDIIGWTKGFAGVLNIFLTLMLVILVYMNLNEEFKTSSFRYFLFIGPILLVGWFFYLMKLLGKKRN